MCQQHQRRAHVDNCSSSQRVSPCFHSYFFSHHFDKTFTRRVRRLGVSKQTRAYRAPKCVCELFSINHVRHVRILKQQLLRRAAASPQHVWLFPHTSYGGGARWKNQAPEFVSADQGHVLYMLGARLWMTHVLDSYAAGADANLRHVSVGGPGASP